MDYKDHFLKLCVTKFREKGLGDEHKTRLKQELKEIEIQGEYEYFFKLYESGKKYENENNLLVAYLLDISYDVDLNSPPAFYYGEFPDVDVDFHPAVRDYLKNEWAPKTFGSDHVCNIGNYTTFGVKSALIDMARVYDCDRAEVLKVTTSLPAKDEDGKDFTLDLAIASNKELDEYCKKYPDVAKAAGKLVGRNRGKGKHAGGLIISNSKIDELVPLIVDSDGIPTSAWPEGLHTQDLQPVGLIKFDLLVITNLKQLAVAAKLIQERRGVDIDWADTSYLDDPDALALANAGKLKGIFQFDSDGIRELVRKGGVTRFDDLVAYSSLFRPGAMGLSMHERYVDRKRGLEEYKIHPLLEPILGKTYGVMVYQEQIMQVLNVVGNIPLRDCYKVLKGISKKREDIFEKYRVKFIENGKYNLNWDEEKVKELWESMASFAGYGFNSCVSYDSLVKNKMDSCFYQVGELATLFDKENTLKIVLDSVVDDNIIEDEVVDAFFVGEEELFEVELNNGLKFKCTMLHEFLCTDNKKYKLKEIIENNLEICCSS